MVYNILRDYFQIMVLFDNHFALKFICFVLSLNTGNNEL